MRSILICSTLVLLAGTLHAGSCGSAPASYGLATYFFTNGPTLGVANSYGATNPITPAWTGDASTDGVVSPTNWVAGTTNNSLTLQITAGGFSWMLALWVDANDDGTWSDTERYEWITTPAMQTGQITISNIVLESRDYLRCKRDHVAVRIMITEPVWTTPAAPPVPSGTHWFGEVEDWRIPVTPVGFSIVNNATLPDAEETVSYNRALTAIHGVQPYAWTLAGGTLPAGLSLVQSGNSGVLSGAPAAGTFTSWGNSYSFTVRCEDSTGAVSQRAFSLRVVHAPAALPFSDSFSTDTGWTYGPTWSRGQATGSAWLGYTNQLGWKNIEPIADHTDSVDNMIIGDNIGGAYDMNLAVPRRATSPVIDCSNAASVELVFWRWVGVEDSSADQLSVQVSADGTNWTTLWCNPNGGMAGGGGAYIWCVVDAGWTRIVYDISAVAANQGRVHVRFNTGPSDWGCEFSGWCVDDVQVRATPQSALGVSQFSIQNAATHGSGEQMCYLGSYNWTAQVSNTSSEDITLDSFTMGIFETPIYPQPQYSWHDVGPWTLTGPLTIAAGATVPVSGTFTCLRCTETGPLQESNAKLILAGLGQTSGLRFEGNTSHILYLWDLPMPGLHVFEYQAGGVEIANGSVATAQRDFGAQVAGSASGWRNIVVDNTSSSTAINLAMPTLSGPGAGEFNLYTPSFSTTLAGGQSTWFSIRFSPTAAGPSFASVSFAHDATNTGTPFTFDITGLGVTNSAIAAVTETAPGGTPISNGAPASGGRDFGSIDINAGATGWLTICVQNQGTTPLTLGTPHLAGASPSEFTLDVTGLAASVAPGANTWFAVAFDPASGGAKSALVRFTHSGAGTASPFEFEVVGTGVLNVPVIVVCEMFAGGPALAPGSGASSYRNFGAQDVGAGATGWRYFHIENRGWLDLLLGTPNMTGADAADFTLDVSGFITTVAAQGSTSIAVAFDPAQQGLRNAWVTFSHNDTGVISPFTFEVRGLATDPNGVVITTLSLPGAKRTIPYDQQLQAAQGTQPYTWQMTGGALPMGLTLASDGRLSGTPDDVLGLYSFSVKVTDSLGGTAQAGLTLMLSPAPGQLGGGGKGGGGGGCAAGNATAAWLLLPALAMFALRKRRRRGSGSFSGRRCLPRGKGA